MAFSVPAASVSMTKVSAAETQKVYCGVGTKEVSKEDQKQMKKLSNALINSIGCELCYEMKKHDTREYDFSRTSVRRTIGSHVLFDDISDADTTSKRVFGVKTKGLKIQPGDWGLAWPELRKIKVTSVGDGKYEICAKVKWVDDEAGKVTPLGTLTIQAEEKEGSYFGFVAKNMKITKVAE